MKDVGDHTPKLRGRGSTAGEGWGTGGAAAPPVIFMIKNMRFMITLSPIPSLGYHLVITERAQSSTRPGVKQIREDRLW